MTPLRIAWNSANSKSPANMRVLEYVAHVADLQCVAKYYFAKRTISILIKPIFRIVLKDNQRHLCCD